MKSIVGCAVVLSVVLPSIAQAHGVHGLTGHLFEADAGTAQALDLFRLLASGNPLSWLSVSLVATAAVAFGMKASSRAE